MIEITLFKFIQFVETILFSTISITFSNQVFETSLK
jgi:hypothetical protein